MNNPEARTGEIMPKEAVVTEERKKIVAVTRGWVTDNKLAALSDQFKNITATTPKGYKACVKAIATVRGLRTRLEKSRMEKNKGDHEKIALRNKEAKRITEVLVKIETPLKEMKRVEDERAEKEKAEKDRVEKERVDAIKQRMEDNFGQHHIDNLAGNPSSYMKTKISIIEAFVVDDEYQEFQEEAARLRRELLDRISRRFSAKRQHEQADKQLQAEKAKLDAQKQEMDAAAKRLEEQQEAFEKERAAWHEKRKAEEEVGKEVEAEAGQAVEEDQYQEPTKAEIAAEIAAQDGAGGAEAQAEVQGGQVNSHDGYSLPFGPQYYDEPEDEDTDEDIIRYGLSQLKDPADELSAESKEALASYGRRTNRERLVELIQEETGIKEFNDDDLTDILSLVAGMYRAKKFDKPTRFLAGQVRKELELDESISD